MAEFCTNCKTVLTKKDKYCPVCNKKVIHTPKDKKKPSIRFIRSLPYIIDTIASTVLLIVASVCKIRANDPIKVIAKYGAFSPEAVNAQRYMHLFNILIVLFGILVAVFGAITLYCLFSKPKENTRFNRFALGITVLFIITVFTASVAYNKHYWERDKIKILKQEELTFSLSGVYGGPLELKDGFKTNLYTYYVSFACAYNDLTRDGDYYAFFQKICKENFPSLDRDITLLNEAYLMQTENLSSTDVVTTKNANYSHLPGKSLSLVSLPSFYDMKILYENYKENNMEHILANKYIDNANMLFDLFCGRELINEEEIYYNAKKYKGVYSHSLDKNRLEITDISLNKEGNGKIIFEYSAFKGKIVCRVTNRKANFKYKDEKDNSAYAMVHITQNTVTVNIWEKDSAYFMKSDSFPVLDE